MEIILNFYTKDFVHIYQNLYEDGPIQKCTGFPQIITTYYHDQLPGATGGKYSDVLKLKSKYKKVIQKYWLISSINK